MRILVLGGTAFLSRAIASDAVRRGHDVVCAARGHSGTVPDGAQLISIDRDRAGSLQALAGERFDAVIDVAKMSLRWVREALEALGTRTEHWTFVSTVNVYADEETKHQTAASALLDPITDHEPTATTDMNQHSSEPYGGVKVASEIAVRDAVGDRAFIVRPGLITGPDDQSDRFGYWPGRFSRGGRVVVPDAPEQPFQHIDVRDLAAWIVDAGEHRLTGTYDGVGPVLGLGTILREIADLAGADSTELVPMSPDALAEAGVNPWEGPKSLPCWLPRTHHGLASHDATSSRDAGLRSRPLADTVRASLAHERALGFDRPRKAGLTAEDEAALLT